MQRHDVAALHCGEWQNAERRQYVAVDNAARRALRLRLAADRDILVEITPGRS
ncbi:MAG: hypothetical protein OXI80_20120 [Caldilineaceae bacterium]|nr:hypothetical protein [Caldilineaceae bacterium]